jgi:hypothetical protein
LVHEILIDIKLKKCSSIVERGGIFYRDWINTQGQTGYTKAKFNAIFAVYKY